MNRFFGPALAAALLAGCSDSSEVSLPPIALGGGSGARIVTGDAKSPAEAYDNRFTEMTKLHSRIRESLRPPSNTTAVRGCLERIVDNVKTMQALVVDEQKSALDYFIREYSDWLAHFNRGMTGGLESAVTELERKLRITVGPSRMRFVSDFPADPGAKRPEKPADPPVVPKPVDEPKKPEPAPAKETTFWMIYAAWKASHQELTEAWTRNKADGAKAYAKVVECLATLKPRLAADAQNTLQVYLDFYRSRAAETKDFTAAPAKEKGTEENVLADLNMLFKQIEAAFSPDRK
jgi:hypothetical protein